jgi:membrane fusion protein (multidrug efflux system)
MWQSEYASTKAQSQLIKAQIAKQQFVLLSGKIGLRSISKGTYITPVMPVANLVNTGKLKIFYP